MTEQSKAIILRSDLEQILSDTRGIIVPKEANEAKELALTQAAAIARVSSAEEQLAAVEAQRSIATLLKLVESSRVLIKKPALDFGRKIDDVAKKFSDELRDELNRVERLIADFQALELAKVRAAEAAERQRLNELDREKQKALAEAKSIEQIDAVQAEFNQKALEAKAPLVIERAPGQIVQESWQFEVVDSLALANSHPTCVKIEPKRTEIKALLDQGIRVAGVKSWKGIRSGVRT